MDDRLAGDDQVVLGQDDAAVASGRAAVIADSPTAGLAPASPAAGRPAAGGSSGPGARWPEIQSMFVDDPHASVEMAAGLASDSIDALIASLRQQQALLSGWQGAGAGTEDLRTALQGYRTFWKRLADFSAQS